MALCQLRLEVGADRAEVVIDQTEGVALIGRYLGNCPPMARDAASNYLADSAAYRANPGRDNEIRARQRAAALRRLREDPQVLFIAVCRPTPNEVRRVIAARAALDVRHENGVTAAMIAAGGGRWRVLALLVDAGAEVAVNRDRGGWTALHFAAKYGNAKAVRVLLGAGVDPDARGSDGFTALALGVRANHPAVVEILVRAGAAVDAGQVVRGRWWTPLHVAADLGDAEMVGILLRAGADPSSHSSSDPFSPLDAAFVSSNPSPSVIRLLVEAGADLGAKGRLSWWASNLAAEMAS
jgi:ankyrin repeat protein